LSEAAESGHIEVVKLLLDAGAHVDARKTFGITPLLAAVRNGHSEVVSLLLDQGADPSAKDFFGNTPLVEAQRSHHEEIETLIKRARRVRRLAILARMPRLLDGRFSSAHRARERPVEAAGKN
jgi:ankyrin repeat protein